MPDSIQLAIEKKLAIAHQMLWTAAGLAETLRDQGLCDDLHALTTEVGRINVDLLTSRGPHKRPSPTVRS
jgi:hypothetical protein